MHIESIKTEIEKRIDGIKNELESINEQFRKHLDEIKTNIFRYINKSVVFFAILILFVQIRV
jgi:hypothetical protein